MAVAIGSSIAASQYNGLQGRIATVLGTGSGNFGYGQAVSSSQVVSAADTISAAQMSNLHSDMTKAYVHQTGSLLPLRVFQVGDIIGADDSGDTIEYDNLGNYEIKDGVEVADNTGGFNDYLDQMDVIENNRFTIDPGQSEEADLATNTRTTNWNSVVNMSFTATFASENNRRYFFNSGGQIRIQLALTSGSGDKDANWASILSNPGLILFGYNYNTVTGSTTGVTLSGNGAADFPLSLPPGSTWNQIFVKNGNSGVYAENRWTVEVREITHLQFEFRIILEDNDVGDQQNDPIIDPAVDEFITGDITATISTRRSINQVVVTNPSIAITNTFE